MKRWGTGLGVLVIAAHGVIAATADPALFLAVTGPGQIRQVNAETWIVVPAQGTPWTVRRTGSDFTFERANGSRITATADQTGYRVTDARAGTSYRVERRPGGSVTTTGTDGRRRETSPSGTRTGPPPPRTSPPRDGTSWGDVYDSARGQYRPRK